MSADYPASVYSPREKENKSGVVFNAGNKTVGYVEDAISLDEEVVAIETELGTEPSGAYDTVKLWLTALGTLLNTHASRHQNGGADELSVAGLNGELADNQPPKTHQATHEHDGSDPLTGAGIEVEKAISFFIDGGGSAIETGIKGGIRIPFKCEILSASLLVDQSGSIVIDIWKDTYANYPPTDADSITSATPPTISATNKDEDTSLTSWTVAIASGDFLMFNVDSVATVEWASLILKVKLVE